MSIAQTAPDKASQAGDMQNNGHDSAKDQAWTPPGSEWEIDWQDEFEGTGEVEKWYPLLGHDPDEYKSTTEKTLRWTDATADSAWMHIQKTGNHWLDGDGNLIMRVVSDKTKSNLLGDKVSCAYLMSGYPEKWDKSEPKGVKWGGKFVSPKEAPLYIACRMRTDQVQGYSTWFAFWLFSQTRAYNDNPTDGTEVDIVEMPKGAADYLKTAFTVANHWKEGPGSSKAKQFNSTSEPKSTDLVDVSDAEYHTYGLEWSTEQMKCYVDGKLYYTFDDHIPTDPVDMMMMLTFEFKVNAWDRNQGDGRVDGPFVSDDEKMREMSRVYIDYVRIYKAKK